MPVILMNLGNEVDFMRAAGTTNFKGGPGSNTVHSMDATKGSVTNFGLMNLGNDDIIDLMNLGNKVDYLRTEGETHFKGGPGSNTVHSMDAKKGSVTSFGGLMNLGNDDIIDLMNLGNKVDYLRTEGETHFKGGPGSNTVHAMDATAGSTTNFGLVNLGNDDIIDLMNLGNNVDFMRAY
jgi:hypothetical protein